MAHEEELKATNKERKWRFTINNPTADDEERVREMAKSAKYIVVGREVGKLCGTPHLQGFVYFQNQRSFSAMRKKLPRAHFMTCQASVEDNAAYCKKDGDIFIEEGDMPEPGKRTDLDEVYNAIMVDGATKRDVARDFKEVMAKYPRYVDLLLKHRAEDMAPKVKDIVPRNKFQQAVLDLVRGEPNPRQFTWFYDEKGGAGKTYCTRYLAHAHGAFFTRGGKTADVAHDYNHERIVIFDIPRNKGNYINYDIMEQMLDGLISSNKYESCRKMFAVPHVIVFANVLPDREAMSKDRYNVWNVTNPHEPRYVEWEDLPSKRDDYDPSLEPAFKRQCIVCEDL